MVKMFVGDKVYLLDEMVEEYSRVCEENKKLKSLIEEKDKRIASDKNFAKECSEFSDKCIELQHINHELKTKISELESKLETSKHLFNIKHSLKEFAGKSPTEYQKELCESYTLEEMAEVVVDLEKQLNEMQEIANKYGDKCSKLESELAKKETLLKIREDWCKECKEKSVIEKLKETPIIEEPLPFSDEEYEEEIPEELRSKEFNFNLVFKVLDVIEMILTDTQS